MLVNSCISDDRIVMEGGNTESGREFHSFTSERDERVKMLVNSCINEDRIVMEGGKAESGREFHSLSVKGMQK